jgi:hypothetical protein
MGDTYMEYGSGTAFSDIDNLHSLAGGNIWQSELREQAEGLCQGAVRISYYLHCNASVVDGEMAKFYLARAEGTVTDANLTLDTTDDELTDADVIDDVQGQCKLVHIAHIDRASQDVKGVFIIYDPGPDWAILIELDSAAGALEASGSTVRYQYFQPGDGE